MTHVARSVSRARRPVLEDRTVVLDLADLAMLSASSDEIEVLPDAWVELDEPTVAELAHEETTIEVYDELEDDEPAGDRELADLVARMTAELCAGRRR
jgi:hypothetical protein